MALADAAYRLGDPADYPRYFVALMGAFVLGCNFALILRGRDIFRDDVLRFWRVLFIGKTLLTLIIVITLMTTPTFSPFLWKTIACGIGFSLILYSFWMIWCARPHTFMVIKPELLSRKDRHKIMDELDEIESHHTRNRKAGTERTS